MHESTAFLRSTLLIFAGLTVLIVGLSASAAASAISAEGVAPPSVQRAETANTTPHAAVDLSPGFGQEMAEMVPSTGPIPRDHYRTWSLFLVCNPAWLEPEKSSDLLNLYKQFRIFGRSIGDDHLAVWFWKKRTDANDPKLAENVDVERSVRFCSALGLTPSAGPHLVVTTEYPDETKLPADRATFELAGLAPAEVTKLLQKLTDELVLKGRADALLTKVLESNGGTGTAVAAPPSLWIRLLEAAQRTIIGFGCKVSVQIKTGFLNAELRECKTP